MLIKEYRVCMPLTTEEYRIAQLYMIQKKSRQETTGTESGVEILINEPYEDGPGGKGQYTFKIYHVGSHLPGWFRSILPSKALCVEEEAWNAYPYTRTRYKVPFVKKFMLDIETRFVDDDGKQENIFNLPPEEARTVQLDVIDIVNDSVPSSEYSIEEDPRKFVSKKTNRGPLNDNWRGENNPTTTMMCAYKLCRVDFCYWGMQSKIERFIHDVAIRKTLLRAHRQAWCWQDEWFGLTIEDIRRLEEETARILAIKMGKSFPSPSVLSEDTIETTIEEATTPASSPNSLMLPNETTRSRASSLALVETETATEVIWNGGASALETLQREESSEEEEDEFYDAIDDLSTKHMTSSLNEQAYRSFSIERKSSTNQSILILVLHGGSLIDTNNEFHNKNVDVCNFRNTLESVLRVHHSQMFGRVSVRLVACPPLLTDCLQKLVSICPLAYEVQGDIESVLAKEFIPFSAIPLLFSSSINYDSILKDVCLRLNDRYREFTQSADSNEFDGCVCIVGDSVGSIIAHDILTSDVQADLKLNFKVNDFFMLGSPISLVLTFRHNLLKQNKKFVGPIKPSCGQVYNLFHFTDPSSFRIESLLCSDFSNIAPVHVCQYSRLCTQSNALDNKNDSINWNSAGAHFVRDTLSHHSIFKDNSTISILAKWWGTKRVDYGIDCPESLQTFSMKALPHLFYSSYWESMTVAAFILRQIIDEGWTSDHNHERATISASTSNLQSHLKTHRSLSLKEKLKLGKAKTTKPHMSHRANDILLLDGSPQVLRGRFLYGPMDVMALSGENIDIYIMNTSQTTATWQHFGTSQSDSSGWVNFTIPENRRLSIGIHPVRMVVQDDRSSLDFTVGILPPKTEVILFSVDGSFAATVSILGKDPKVRPGGVDVARYWHELGFLLIYVSARPAIQHRRVVHWLTQHNFPHGMCLFSEGLSRNPIVNKAQQVHRLVEGANLDVHCAYGSSKDITMYHDTLQLPPEKIFVTPSRRKAIDLSQNATILVEGYTAHLQWLKESPFLSRSAHNGFTKGLQRMSFSSYERFIDSADGDNSPDGSIKSTLKK